jgi:tricorn protease-like protein
MIFSAKNEKNIPTWKLVLTDKKTVTRRLKSIKVGKIIAVQPGRGKKAVCKIQVLSCIRHEIWWVRLPTGNKQFTDEAEKEGFYTWHSLMEWFASKKIDPFDTYRIEFERIKDV